MVVNLDPTPVLGGKPRGGRDNFGEDGDNATNFNASAHPLAPAPLAPILSLCKTSAFYDVLYPNMYFASPHAWTAETAGLQAAHERSPWRERLALMWWRGAAGDPSGAGGGAQLRIRALTKWHEAAWADMAFTDKLRPRLYSLRAAIGVEAFAAQFPSKVWGVRAGTKHKMPMREVARYMYALHLPGSFLKTYSRSLQFLLWTGAVTFKVASPFYEHYYRHLIPWVHFVPTTVDGLGARLEQVAGTGGKLASKISAEANEFARTRLSASAIAAYWMHLFRDYAALQRFTVASRAASVNSSVAGRSLCTCYSVSLPVALAAALAQDRMVAGDGYGEGGTTSKSGVIRAPAELCPSSLCRFVPGSVVSTQEAARRESRATRKQSTSKRPKSSRRP